VRSCRRMVGEQSAADAAQDAVLTAMLSLDRLRRPEAFGSWLVGIGLNACRAALRGDSPLHRAAPRTAAEGGLSPLTDPHESAVASEIAARVRFAIDSLPKGQREAVTLYYLAGLTQAEAAEHLGIPPGAVKTRLHKARASLRARLEPLRRERSVTIEMHVADVRRAGERHVLMLEGGGRELRIWVGPAEASAIAVLLEDVELPRPGTHHLAAALLTATDASVREVRITRLAETIFYADVVLSNGMVVDARPSDAITLALVTGARVLVDPAVLDAAERPDPEWEGERAAADASTEGRQVLADEARRRLSRR